MKGTPNVSITFLDKQLDELRDQATRAQSQYSAAVRSIESDTTLSDEGKRVQKDELRASTKASLEGLREREMQLVNAEITSIERRLDAHTGSTASDIIAFRDAQDRAERLDDAEDAQRVMARALRTNDKTLAHAVFRRALEAHWPDAMTLFQQSTPNAAEDAKDLNTLVRFRDDAGFQRAIAYSLF